MHWFRSLLTSAGFGLILGGLTLACGPAAAPQPTAVAADPYAVVRATSQAAYVAGKDFLDRGDLRGCPLIDTAKTNDPENRPEIQLALERCLVAIAELPTSTAAPPPAQRTIVLATLPATTPVAVAQSTPAAVAKPTSVGSPVAAATRQAAPAQTLVSWRDPQGRFTISAPADWPKADQAQALFGTGVVQFHDPSGQAEVDVAVDTSTKVVSPELYAASMEITMQQQVPGYASEQVLPTATSNSPSIRRIFTFMLRDASGHDFQARGFQVTVLKGSTPYIISGSAPAEQFQQYGATFDQMVETFRFS
jgi:hypothetical protein